MSSNQNSGSAPNPNNGSAPNPNNGSAPNPNNRSVAQNATEINADNIDAFIMAILTGKIADVIQYLIEGNPYDMNAVGWTPLTALLRWASVVRPDLMPDSLQEEMLDAFLEIGISLDNPDGNGLYPVFATLHASFPVALKVFNNADVTQTMGPKNINVLMAAATLGLEEVIDFIHGEFDLNAQDTDGNTALHHAVLADRSMPTRMAQTLPRDIVDTLCKLGADVMIENNEGQTPQELAMHLGKYDVALTAKHCSLPKEGFHKIKIKMNPEAEPSDFYVHNDDLIADVKKALLFEDYRDFNFLLPRFQEHPVMDNIRTFADYAIRDGDVITIIPIIRSGLKGGKRSKTRRRSTKRRATRRN